MPLLPIMSGIGLKSADKVKIPQGETVEVRTNCVLELSDNLFASVISTNPRKYCVELKDNAGHNPVIVSVTNITGQPIKFKKDEIFANLVVRPNK